VNKNGTVVQVVAPFNELEPPAAQATPTEMVNRTKLAKRKKYGNCVDCYNVAYARLRLLEF